MIFWVLVISLLLFAVVYLGWQFIHNLRHGFEVDDLRPLSNGRRPR